MKIVNFENKKSLTSQKYVNGNLAVSLDKKQSNFSEIKDLGLKEYDKPAVKKLVLVPSLKKNTRIFMGCYAYSWPANDGDGC